MKKTLLFLFTLASLFTISGCFNTEDEMTNEEILEFCNTSKENREDEICSTTDEDGYKVAYSRYEGKEHLKLSEYIGEDSDKSISNLDTKPYLIYMYAGWCPHCQENITPLSTLIEEQTDTKFFFINTDEFATNNIEMNDFSSLITDIITDDSIISDNYKKDDDTISITSVPTAIIIKGGKLSIITSGTDLETLKTYL